MTEFKILTLNCWGVPFSSDRQRRIGLIATALAARDYDIVCLQEIWKLEDLEVIIRESGFAHWHHYPSGVLGSGLVILSRYPIREVAFHQFVLGGTPEKVWQGDFIAGKGVGLARVETPIGMIDVYNTHTVAQYRPDDVDEHRAHRAAQMYAITQFIASHSHVNPVVICGDFNMKPHQSIYRMFKTLTGMTDCYTALRDDVGITYDPANPYNEGKEAQRLDYIFTKSGVEASLAPTHAEVTMTYVQDIAYSDHSGVGVTFSLAPPEAAVIVPLYPIRAELKAVLEQGLVQAGIRRQGHIQQIVMSLLVLAVFRRSPVLFYTFIRWLYAYLITPNEINGLKAALAQISVEQNNEEI